MTEHCLVFDLIHAKLGKDDNDVLFPFLKNGEKKTAFEFWRLFS